MRPDQQRVQTLLTDTVTLLCKNGLQYKKELKVQGLLGITLDDDDVFIVHINKIFDDIRGKVSSVNSDPDIKVTNIPPSNSLGEYEDQISFFDKLHSNVTSSTPPDVHVTNIPPSTTISEFENVDGRTGSYEEEKVDSDSSVGKGMQLPVIHSLQTSILNRQSVGVAKKKTTNKGTKRPVGAAKRKEHRSVKQRLSSSFTPKYEIQVKDEPPDEMIIAPGDDHDDSSGITNGEHSQGSVYKHSVKHDDLAALGVHPSQNSMSMYERLEEEGSPLNSTSLDKGDQAMDMIECLLYNEQSEGSQANVSGIYNKVHISGAEDDSPMDGQEEEDILAGCSTWDDSQDAPPTPTPTSASHKSSKAGSKLTSSPVLDDSVTYHGIARQDVNDSLAAQYRDLLEAAAVQGDGYPCVECDQILKTRAIWMEHMKGVHMNRKYACPHCGETFKWRSSRKRHILITHTNESELERVGEVTASDPITTGGDSITT